MAPRQTPKTDKAKDKPKADTSKDVKDEAEKAEEDETEESQEDESEQEDTEEESESEGEDGEDEDSEDEGEDKTRQDESGPKDPESGLQTAKETKSQVIPDEKAPKPNRAKVADEVTQAANDKPDDLSDSYLDSPHKFGIWIGGTLVQFNKGKTRLTNKQKEICLTHKYVADNGAHVAKLVKRK